MLSKVAYFKKIFSVNGYTTPIIVLDGADIESVVSVVSDKDHLLRHVVSFTSSKLIASYKKIILNVVLISGTMGFVCCHNSRKSVAQIQVSAS